MNDKTAESSVATGLRITFAIIGAVIIMVCTCAVALRVTVLNDTFWGDLFKSTDFRELLKEEMGLNSHTFHLNHNSGITLDFTDEDAQDEFIDLFIDDYLEFVSKGEFDIDRDEYEDFFDKYEDELFGDQDLTSAQKREEIELFLDDIEDLMEQYDEENDNSDAFSFMQVYQKAARRTLIIAVVTFVILVAMTAVLIVIHKNKFRPIRAMGISMTCAQFLNTMGWGMVVLAFSYAGELAEEDGEEIQLFISKLGDYAGYITLFMAVTMFIGIAMIIIGAVGAKRTNERLLEEC
ncbi:MAG: hypothetical protein IJR15_04825 [Clostridiales bacterium]|nr:hypothetical protein [Clostridiales bacterium]